MITEILIGAGQRGMDAYASYALSHSQDFKIVAVAEPIQERRKQMQKTHNIPNDLTFDDWQELLAKEKMADCVLVCNQDRFHAEPVKIAIEKGYHVLCEKPMSPNAEDCLEMGEYAEKYGKTITVCHVLRYSPLSILLR